MKKTLCAFIFSALCALPLTAVAANVGDVIGAVTYSGLDTYVNNYPINAYHMNGRQVICAEDLANYGFNVTYDNNTRSLYIDPYYSTSDIAADTSIKREYYLQGKKAYDVLYSDINVYINGNKVDSYNIDGRSVIPIRALESLGHCEYNAEENYSKAFISGLPEGVYSPLQISYDKKLTIVLDAGHGKSSSLMSNDEKIAEGYTKNNGWGEWRHWKNGTANQECEGSGCNNDHSCWYPIGNGDRDIEPDINLQNVLYAKWYLENELGYNVRLTRQSNNENPSFSKRVSYCYPNNDMTQAPDASIYLCIHSNAGGGRGSAYIAAEGNYTQKWVRNNYVSESNKLGSMVNHRIVVESGLSQHGNGIIGGEGYLILFNKSPIPTGYMEIGFFDSRSDLNIINSRHDEIGKAIAYGADDYLRSF